MEITRENETFTKVTVKTVTTTTTQSIGADGKDKWHIEEVVAETNEEIKNYDHGDVA